jgi:DNA-binding NarL/FixJ family response regulator
MNVLIVDDHPATRQGLATIVRDAFRVERVVEVDGARDALLAARRDSPALILLDLRMPGGGDTSVLVTQLRLAAPAARIAIITAYEDAELIQRCFAAGADGCLLKDTSVVDMRVALQSIARGHRVIDPRIAQTLANAHVAVLRGKGTSVKLTQREREVLQLLAEGCSNRLIADRLFISETTVKSHVSALLEKLGARSRLQAVINANTRGVIGA